MNVLYETDVWPFIKAKYFTEKTDVREVKYIVIHTMEAPDDSDTAENVARYFQNPEKEVSAHVCVDNDSVVQCVLDNDVAWGARGANNAGIQIELAGYSDQTPQQWKSEYNVLLINNAANVVAQYCLKYKIPVRQLTNDQLASGEYRGIVGHNQVTEVFKKSDHTDPGEGFPWAFLLERVGYFYQLRK